MKFLGTEIGEVNTFTQEILGVIGDIIKDTGAAVSLRPRSAGYFIGCAGNDPDAPVIYINTRTSMGNEQIRLACGVILGVRTGSITYVDTDAEGNSFVYRFSRKAKPDDTLADSTRRRFASDADCIRKMFAMTALCQK